MVACSVRSSQACHRFQFPSRRADRASSIRLQHGRQGFVRRVACLQPGQLLHNHGRQILWERGRVRPVAVNARLFCCIKTKKLILNATRFLLMLFVVGPALRRPRPTKIVPPLRQRVSRAAR